VKWPIDPGILKRPLGNWSGLMLSSSRTPGTISAGRLVFQSIAIFLLAGCSWAELTSNSPPAALTAEGIRERVTAPVTLDTVDHHTPIIQASTSVASDAGDTTQFVASFMLSAASGSLAAST
jgi:hypothetical protein